jgi:dTDP-4-amino-4,6-dideoxygalactose transaminase
MIGFNKPYSSGKEIEYINDAIAREKISGNGYYTQKCQGFLEKRYGIKKALLTSSCTDALEMAALLIDTEPGDEIIMPSYTFVSTANAFVLRGANIVFADSHIDNPNIDETKIEELITKKTKAIVVVHYAGFSCNMDVVMSIAKKYNLYVIEDAAQAIESKYKNRPLGSIGHLACFSFHETKNIISGEGGALLINEQSFVKRAEVIWEKGTNRSAFFRGEINKYGWIDIGSSFLPSEITAAFLWAQLESIDNIQSKRQQIWSAYYEKLKKLEDDGLVSLPSISPFNQHNAHIFYLVCRSENERNQLLDYLNNNGINAIFHYLALHKSKFYFSRYKGKELLESIHYESTLVRLPVYYELCIEEVQLITDLIFQFYDGKIK